MARKHKSDGEPRLPDDLPPLPSRFYRARPKPHRCRVCEGEFATPEELNEHARRAHALDAA